MHHPYLGQGEENKTDSYKVLSGNGPSVRPTHAEPQTYTQTQASPRHRAAFGKRNISEPHLLHS